MSGRNEPIAARNATSRFVRESWEKLKTVSVLNETVEIKGAYMCGSPARETVKVGNISNGCVVIDTNYYINIYLIIHRITNVAAG